jgi:hypothetical protein
VPNLAIGSLNADQLGKHRFLQKVLLDKKSMFVFVLLSEYLRCCHQRVQNALEAETV